MEYYILAAILAWNTADGLQQKEVTGTFSSHAKCMEFLKVKQLQIRVNYGVRDVLPIGGKMCIPESMDPDRK